MYNKESLARLNPVNVCEHGWITEQDVDMVNRWIQRIESTRNESSPMVGDIVRLTNDHSEYFHHAHIDEINQNKVKVCEQPYVPFVTLSDSGIACCTSGGAWESLDTCKLHYMGKERKMFKDFGSSGVCAHGSLNFEATVNVWEYTAENRPYGEYTTKDWKRDFIRYCEKDRDGSPYHYFGKFHAYKTEQEYLAWLLTYKGVEFEGGAPEQTTVFFYRKQENLLSKEEWDALKLPTDTRMMNGTILLIKYQYDDDAHVIHEYRYANVGEFNPFADCPYRVAREKLKNGQYNRHSFRR